MRIGIVSDTHDCLPMIAKAIDGLLAAGVGHVLHAGDFVAPFAVKPLARLHVPVSAVYGNNDGERQGLAAAFEPFGTVRSRAATCELPGCRAVVVHEPLLLHQLAHSGDFDLCVYGHTHEVDISRDCALIINPGEVCGYVSGRATMVVLDLDTMEPEVIEL